MSEEAEESAPACEWTVHLAARWPGRALLLSLAIALAAAWAAFVFGHVLALLATAGLLMASVSEFLFPVRYRLTPEFAEARGPVYWRRIAWSDVKRVYVGEREIKLSPLKHGGPREAFRGVVLRLEGDLEPTRAAIRRFRERAASASEVEPAATGRS